MKITNGSLKLSTIFEINEGDIFLYNDHYYIAGEVRYIDHVRTCYDISINLVRNFTVNDKVYAWYGDDCELIIK